MQHPIDSFWNVHERSSVRTRRWRDTVLTLGNVMRINQATRYPSGEEGLIRDVAYTYKFPKAARKEGPRHGHDPGSVRRS